MENYGQFGHTAYETEKLRYPWSCTLLKVDLLLLTPSRLTGLTAARFQKVLRYLIRVVFISRDSIMNGVVLPLGSFYAIDPVLSR